MAAPADRIGRRRLLHAGLGLLALACWAPLRANGAELRIVLGPNSDATSQIAAALTRQFPDAPASPDAAALAAREGAGVFLAIGPAALQAALRADVPGPLISAFVSSEAYLRLLTTVLPRRTRPVTAIYAEAAPAAQMQLIRRIYGRKVLVGVLLSPATRHMQPAIERAASANGLDVSLEEVAAGANPARSLSALSSASVLLAVPDPDLYNAEIARAILESTYRRGQAVIGFSKAMVSAGTLGAAYATIDDVVAQLPDLVQALRAGRSVDAQHPLYWRVAINDSVARRLDVPVDAATRGLGNFPH